MKTQVFNFMKIAVLSLILAGICFARPPKFIDSTAIQIETEIISLVSADLVINPKKAIGKAFGDKSDVAYLEKLAVANALGQNPPSVDRPDVLVATKLYYGYELAKDEWGYEKERFVVTASGYPAFYTNFRNVEYEDDASVGVYIANDEKISARNNENGLLPFMKR